ncbi:MAG: radical SAM protein [Clostridiales bacterium]|nr:radical SAM protein [Eubacteriales bacterium]MDH7566149.1 radical SAM protein [Clostridiales bacterium]
MENKASKCGMCPRACNIDRAAGKGFCGMGSLPVVAKAFLHMWEEPCISGSRGSGAVFFSGCNLKCVYCQNYTISQENFGRKISIEALSRIYLSLQQKGAHNINLVNPSHFTVQIRESLDAAKELSIPVVYNSNGYDSLESLKQMEGRVQVYLPDLKYFSPGTSREYSGAPDYFQVAAQAVLEMCRQTGTPVFDGEGLMQKGLIVRHLILPGLAEESIKILDWIKANLPGHVLVSLMSQYTPYYKADCHPKINRRITRREYDRVVNHFLKLGFENGYIQERDSAEEGYIPDFNLEGVDG